MKTKSKSASQRRAENRQRTQNIRSTKAVNTEHVANSESVVSLANQNAHAQLFEQQYSFHDFDPTTVLHGEINIAALDQFSMLCGLIPPSWLYGATQRGENIGSHKCDPGTFLVQIHYVSGHYLVSCQQNNIISVYDTLPCPHRTKQVLPQLKTLYTALNNTDNPLQNIEYKVSQFQGTTVDCGVFAVANVHMLISGKNPQTAVLNQSKLRPHILHCLLTKCVTAFPVLEKDDPLSSSVLMNKYFTSSTKREMTLKSQCLIEMGF